MISAVSLIAASAANSGKPGGGPIKAVVSGGPDREGAFTLRLEGGQEVKIPISDKNAAAALKPGMSVTINFAEGKITFAEGQQPAQSGQSGQAPLTSLTDPLTALGQQSSTQTPQSGAQAKQAPVMISVNIAMSPQKIAEGFESPLMKSVPVEVIERAVSGKGGMSAEILDLLTRIDNLLKGRSLAIDPASQSQTERIEQWLRVALDNPKLVDDLVERIPITGPKNVGELIDKLMKLVMADATSGTANKGAAGGKDPLMAMMNSLSAATDKNVSSNNSLSANNPLFSANNKAELIPNLSKTAFSNMPATLLGIVKQIDASPQQGTAAGNVKLPPSEAQRIVADVAAKLPKQTSVSSAPETLHDGKRLSPAIVSGDIDDAAARKQTQTSPQARVQAPSVPVQSSQVQTPTQSVKMTPPQAQTSPTSAQTSAQSIQTPLPQARVSTPSVQTSAQSIQTPSPQAQTLPTSVQTPAQPIHTPPVNLYTSSINTHAPLTNLHTPPASAQTQQPPVQTPPSAVVPQIKSIYATLTESAVQILVGGGETKTAALDIREKLDVMRALVDKIPVDTEKPVTVSKPVAADKNIIGGDPTAANKNAAVDKPVITADKSAITTDKPMATADKIAINADKPIITADKPAVSVDKPIILGDRPIAADKPVITVDKLPASSQPSQPPVTDIPAIKNTAAVVIDNLRAVIDVVIGKIERSAESGRAASSINTANTAASSQQVGISTNKENAVSSQQAGLPTNKENTASSQQVGISTNKENAASPQQTGASISTGNTVSALDTGERLQLLGAVRDTIMSLESALRPLAHEERPVPQKFYERIASDTNQRQITAEARAAVFTRIDAAQSAVRQLIESSAPPSATHVDTGNKSAGDPPAANTQAHTVSADNTNAAATAPAFLKAQFANGETAQTAQRIWVITENLQAGFRDAFSSLDLQNRVTPVDQSGASSTQTIRQGIDALRTEILLEVSGAIREIFSSIEELRANAAPLLGMGGDTGTNKNIAHGGGDANANANAARAIIGKISGIEDAVLRVLKELETQAQRSGTDIADRLKDVLKEMSRLQVETSKLQQAQTQQQNQNIGDGTARHPSPADVIRATALTAARSLESLSLLAAQTRGADSQQQIVALPVKIGQEWAEVQIKLIKDRRHGKGKDGGKGEHVSVYLNTAPSKLGEITAHFDFDPPANLKLSVQFERPEVTKWFREQSAELKDALARAGLPGASLTFHSKRAARKQIDDTIDASANVVKDGKVDFKI